LFEAPPDVLKEKCIVTEVISCSAYLMHLHDNGEYIQGTQSLCNSLVDRSTAVYHVAFCQCAYLRRRQCWRKCWLHMVIASVCRLGS
jgi:hypothetical protein